ncbi:MAG: FeoA family protein [Syntrophomonas sp.]|nr:FeoA family protein [Syntrophomonas sp.]
MGSLIPLHQLSPGSSGIVKKLTAQGNERRRMMDLGLVYNTKIKSLQKSPCGDPIAYELRGVVIALRSESASQILVEYLATDE